MAHPNPDELDAFTLRIPRSLKDQIDTRAKLQHRTRNAEIIHLLSKAIDDSVDSDNSLKRNFSHQRG
ncbi:Arc-like DNA binding domain protein [Achromobacter phage JWF]|uniref:Arc-like DNA binding domain protein n=1 Tax=Achromobacter phage JWF TaxID=1589748 RepID=UPI000588E5B6|nr:Arc-like DNA binding domain protein [Achromobacter phage JWF]AJD82911.1 Arc-like DNA binding domain protein [Achromobacter phage JWF]